MTYIIRDATAGDLEDLCRVRNSRILLAQYLSDAENLPTRLLVCEIDGELAGFVELDFTQHAGFRPRFNDLYVAHSARSRGVGSALIAYMEQAARAYGFQQLCCTVDPINNPRALALYRRLGYVAVQDAPYATRTTFYDHEGDVQEHVSWRLDLQRTLGDR